MHNSLKNTAREFKDLADNLTVDVATDGLWAAIETELPPVKEKKKVLLFWWVGMVAAIVLITTAGYTTGLFDAYFTNHQNDTLLTKTIINETQQTIDKNQYSNNKNQAKATKNQNASLTHNTSKTNENKNETLDNKPNTTLFTNPNTIKNNRRNTPDFIITNDTPVLAKKGYPTILSIAKVNSHESITKKRMPSSSTPEVATLTAELLPLQYLNHGISKPLVTPASKKLNWYIQFSSGINQNWSQNSLVDLNVENDRRFAKETDVYGVTSNVMFGLKKQKWSFALGVSHAIQASRYTQAETITTQQNIPGVIQSKIADSGLQSDIHGQIIQTTVQRYDIDWHRIHSGLDIQVEIGRTLYRKGKFSVNAYAGIGYNIWSKHSGYYFEAGENSIVKINNNTVSPYKNKIGVKYNGAVSVNYDLGKMNIGLSPFIKYSNTSIIKNSAFYTLKNSQYGLQVRMTIRP